MTDLESKASEPTPDEQTTAATGHPPAAPPAVAPSGGPTPATEPPEPTAAGPQVGFHWGTGRRKSAVARVRLMPGDGNVTINRRDVADYFTEPQDQMDAVAPLELTGIRKHWDVKVNVHGGGHSGQAGAVRLGLSRAILKAYRQFEPTLRDAGYLTRDARRVERKKPGQRKARRRFQFSKR